jgi:hypothetical protein
LTVAIDALDVALPLMTKIDLFVCGSEPFDITEFTRRRAVRVRGDATLFVKSPEDSILRKLLWYIAGGEVSTNQWRDVVAVLRVGGEHLDRDYLDSWARRLGLARHLERAQAEAATIPNR